MDIGPIFCCPAQPVAAPACAGSASLPKGDVAPAAAATKRKLRNGKQANYFDRVKRWIMDTGSGVDICQKQQVPKGAKTVKADEHIVFNTANGPIDAGPMFPGILGPFDEPIAPFILPDTPALLTVGKRCFCKGYGFIGFHIRNHS